MKTSFRTVADTNIIISSQFPSPNSPNKEFIDRLKNKEFTLLHSKDILREYIKKLLHHKIPLEDVKSLYRALREIGESVEIKAFHFPKYPDDLDDIPFLLCAGNGNATHIISYDSDLKSLNGYYDFKICETLEFLFELRKELEKI